MQRRLYCLELHKIRNVRDELPDKLLRVVERRMREAHHADSALAAQSQLETLAGARQDPTPTRHRPPRRLD